MSLLTDNKHTRSLDFIEQLSQFIDKNTDSNIDKQVILHWVMKFMHFNDFKQPEYLDKKAVEDYLSYVAEDPRCNFETQSQAIKALEFLYQQFLNSTLEDLHFTRLKQCRGFLSRFNQETCDSVIQHLDNSTQLLAKLCVGANLKLKEVIHIKVEDLDLKSSQLLISFNNKNKRVAIPKNLLLDLRIQSMKVHKAVQQTNEQLKSKNNVYPLEKSLNAKKQFLFPLKINFNHSKNTIEIKPFSLCILKSNLRIAIKQHLLYSEKPTLTNNRIQFKSKSLSQKIKPANDSSQCFLSYGKPAAIQKSFDFSESTLAS